MGTKLVAPQNYYMKKNMIISIVLFVSCTSQEPNNVLNTDKQEVKESVHINKKEFNNSSTDTSTYKEFSVDYTITGNVLTPHLKTDLPQNTNIVISISRYYWEKNDEYNSDYSVDYFNETRTVSNWGEFKGISLDDNEWEEKLHQKQVKMAEVGLGFDIKNISDSITITAIITSGNYPYPKLIPSKRPITHVRLEKGLSVNIPSKNKNIPQYIHNVNDLKKGETYQLSRKTPLMPFLYPKNHLTALSMIKDIQATQLIQIIEIEQKNNTPWYNVIVTNNNQDILGRGWVNSIALIGQKIKIIETKSN